MSVHDYFIEMGRYYLVMSYIEGVDLEEVLELEGNPGLPENLECHRDSLCCSILNLCPNVFLQFGNCKITLL